MALHYPLYRKTRNRRRKRSLKQKRTARRRSRTVPRKYRGGGFSYVVPDSAIVEWRSLDDNGTNPPILLLKSERDKALTNMEHVY